MPPEPLLSSQTLAKLEAYDLASRKTFLGRFKGERRSTRKGRSVEFADFRNYSQGDDLRFVDWNGFARLDRLFLKLFFEEEDLHLYGLLDASPSMDFGEPTKFDAGRRLLAALGFIGLIRAHRVKLETLGQGRRPSPAWRGRGQVRALFDRLRGWAPQESVPLADGVRDFVLRNPSRGVVVLVSDLLDKRGFDDALRTLAARRSDVYVVHVLSREELRPDVAGDLRLVDCEDRTAAEITVAEPLLRAYDRTLRSFLNEAREFCVARGMQYVFLENDAPLERAVLEVLRRQGAPGR